MSDLIQDEKNFQEALKQFAQNGQSEVKSEVKKEQGRRYNKGKIRKVLFPAFAKKCIDEVYTKGAHKYSIYADSFGNKVLGKDIPIEKVSEYRLIDDAKDNWRKGLSWMDTLDSHDRHIEAWLESEDFDPELGTYHIANAIWNLVSILEMYKIYPEGDDRPHKYLTDKKIGLDIDGVICNFEDAYCQKYNHPQFDHWSSDYKTRENLEDAIKTEDFYKNLEPLIKGEEMPFEPHCYITSRSIPVEWTMEWLQKNRFPAKPVYTLPFGSSKVDTAKKAGIDIFVDDSYTNFKELNKGGICTFLMDRPHNRKYNVGYKRIKSLKELV